MRSESVTPEHKAEASLLRSEGRPTLPAAYFGAIFMSNYLDSGYLVIEQLRAARTLARKPNRVVILQPNIQFARSPSEIVVDHRVALTERGLVEAAARDRHYDVEYITRMCGTLGEPIA